MISRRGLQYRPRFQEREIESGQAFRVWEVGLRSAHGAPADVQNVGVDHPGDRRTSEEGNDGAARPNIRETNRSPFYFQAKAMRRVRNLLSQA